MSLSVVLLAAFALLVGCPQQEVPTTEVTPPDGEDGSDGDGSHGRQR